MCEIYNMTTHMCDNERVETEPRLAILRNVSDKEELLTNITNGLSGIPKGSNVMVGGHPNYLLIMQQIAKNLRLRLWLYDSRTGNPYTATFATRTDRYMIERAMINEPK